MNRTDDISSLFNRFGGSSDSYHEFDSQLDYKEPVPKATPPVAEPELPVNAALGVAKEGSALQPASPPLAPEVSLPLTTPVAEVEQPVPMPVAEVEQPVPMPVAEVEQPVPMPVAEVEQPVPTLIVEVEQPVPTLVAEVEQPVPTPVAKVEQPVPVAEIELPKPMPMPVIVPLARPETVPAKKATRTPLLRNLLAEVVQARQAEEQAAAAEALANARPPKCKAHVVAVVSSKGGVGKTTLSAALAGCLRLGGGQTLSLDLDPQNALYYHLGVESGSIGIGNAAHCETTWKAALQAGFSGAKVLPYGALSDEERRTLEHRMSDDQHWLAWQLDAMGLCEQDVVILDTPTGRNLYLQQALDVADEVIVVTTADAASFITLDQMDHWLNAEGARPGFSTCHYVVNQFDASHELSRDMLEVFKRRLGKKLMAVIARDKTFDESLAYGRDPLADPQISLACQDVQLLAQQIKSRFANVRASGLHA